MTGIFFSRGAWVLIPPIASVICLVGLVAAFRIVHITHRELDVHFHDGLTAIAKYMHSNAHFRTRVLGLIMTAGVLVTIPQLVYSPPPPPTHGWWWCLWVNHYLVGATASYLTAIAIHAYLVRVRRNGMHV